MLQAGLSRTYYPKSIVILSVSQGIFYVYISTYTLSVTLSAQFVREAISFQRKCQPANLPARVLIPWEGSNRAKVFGNFKLLEETLTMLEFFLYLIIIFLEEILNDGGKCETTPKMAVQKLRVTSHKPI